MNKLWLILILNVFTSLAYSMPFVYIPKTIDDTSIEQEEPERPERPPKPQDEADEEECEDSVLLPKNMKKELL